MPSIDDPVINKAGAQPAGVKRVDSAASLVDTDGDLTLLQVDASGALRVTGGGGGTEYTEDAAAPANPVGTALQLVRADTPAGVASTDGDFVTQRATNYGAAYTQLVTSTGSFIDSVGGGTEYTEDAAAAANPLGKANILVRSDTPASEVSTNGDNIAQRGTAYGAAYCQMLDSSGNFIDSFGGGTQYTEGDIDASITGTAMMMEVGSNTLQPVQGTVTDGLLVNLGSNNDVTVTGTVAVTQSGTWDEVGINDSGNSITVDNDTLSVVGGGVEATALRVTIASDSTGVLSVDDNGGSLTVDGTVTATIAAGATTIAKAEDVASADADVGVPAMAVRKATPANTSGTDGDYEFLQMSAGRLWTSATIDTALPAGTNAIGKLASNSGVTIGAVEIAAAQTLATVTNVATIGTSVTPGTAAANLGKAEDAARSTGDTGVMALAVRSNTAASTSGSDGDYQPLITNTTGHLWVDASGQTLTVASHAVTNAGTFAVQATVAAGATNIAKAEDVASADADVGVPSMAVRKATPANTSGTDGDYEFLQMSAGRLWTSATIDAALPAGTNAIGKLAANSGVDIGDVDVLTLPNVTLAAGTNTNEVVGDAAHDAAVAGNPLRIGGRAITSEFTAVASGDTCDIITTTTGKVVTALNSVYALRWSATGELTSTTAVTIKAAAGAGVKNVIDYIKICNSNGTTDTKVQINDGAGGTAIWTGWAENSGGGEAGAIPPLASTTNTLLEIKEATATSTNGVFYYVAGYTSAE